MPSLFEQALANADKTIENVMMREWLINGKPYQATYDETQHIFNGLHRSDDVAVNGTEYTLTLFRSSGYKPRVNDKVVGANKKKFLVKAYHFIDQLIVLQLE